jgi:hypothetical protein
VPESLFDDFCRNDGRPALFDEPTFGFLNRRAGARWQRVRRCGITQAPACRSTRSAPCYGTHGSTSHAGRSSTTRQR